MNSQDLLDNYGLIIGTMSRHHELFYKIACVGKPKITTEIKTAAVRFYDGKFLDFLFNPDFLSNLNFDGVRFIIAHEIKHILLNHGIRGQGLTGRNQLAMWWAQDLVINESLINNFKFNLAEMPFLDGAIYFDSLFEEYLDEVEYGRESEYYYNKILEIDDKNNNAFKDLFNQDNQGTLDDHNYLLEITDDDVINILTQVVNDPDKAKKLFNEIKKKAEETGASPTTDYTSVFDLIYSKNIKSKKRWLDHAKNLRHSIKKSRNVEDYQWIKPNFRTQLLPKKLSVPFVSSHYDEGLDKEDFFIFSDVSGSCECYVERFWRAAQSIPTDVFNVKFHVFNTSVEEVDIQQKQRYHMVGGGTDFKCIEEFILQKIQYNYKKYPKSINIITDGQSFGARVQPYKPENWSWFLTEDSDDYISQLPYQSKIFHLKDYE